MNTLKRNKDSATNALANLLNVAIGSESNSPWLIAMRPAYQDVSHTDWDRSTVDFLQRIATGNDNPLPLNTAFANRGLNRYLAVGSVIRAPEYLAWGHQRVLDIRQYQRLLHENQEHIEEMALFGIKIGGLAVFASAIVKRKLPYKRFAGLSEVSKIGHVTIDPSVINPAAVDQGPSLETIQDTIQGSSIPKILKDQL